MVPTNVRQLFNRLVVMHRENNLLTGAAGVFILQIAGLGAAYVMQALLANWMGVADFGSYIYAYNWGRLLALFGGLGLTLSVLKFVPDYIAGQEWGKLRGVINAFSVMTLIGSGILGLVAAGIFQLVPPDEIDLLTLTIGLLLTPLFAITYLYVDVLRGMHFVFLAYGPLNVGQNVLMMLAGGAIFLATGGLTSVQGIGLLGAVLLSIAIFQIIAILRGLPPLAQGVQAVYDTMNWVRTSLPMLLIRGFAVIMDQVDVLMVGLLLGAIPTGIYAVVSRTANLTSFALSAVNAVTAPRISPLYNQGQTDELEQLAKRATLLSLAISVLMFTGIVVFADFLLSLFGEAFLAGRTTLIILGIGHLVNSAVGPVGFLMHLTGHQRISSRIYGVSMVVNIVLNYAFIVYGGLGIEGAAIATAITMAFQNIWMYIAVRRNLHISTLPFL